MFTNFWRVELWTGQLEVNRADIEGNMTLLFMDQPESIVSY